MSDLACTIKDLPIEHVLSSAETAKNQNPMNAPRMAVSPVDSLVLPPEHLAVLTSRYWGTGGVHLTVGFLDGAPGDLQARILSHMNAWGAFCNVKFVLSNVSPQVRIARAHDGYWSFLGTDILSIPPGQPTMNLEGFTMSTPESEFHRVVRHETGHTLGFPHEHMRKQLVERLDQAKTIAWGASQLGWSASMVIQQILTPINEVSIRGTPNADQDSVMCYALPASITIDGQPIHGGVDIDELDKVFAKGIYPLEVAPPPPPKPPVVSPGGTDMFAKILALIAALKAKDWVTVFKVVLELIDGLNTGSIPMSDLEEVERSFTVASRTVRP